MVCAFWELEIFSLCDVNEALQRVTVACDAGRYETMLHLAVDLITMHIPGQSSAVWSFTIVEYSIVVETWRTLVQINTACESVRFFATSRTQIRRRCTISKQFERTRKCQVSAIADGPARRADSRVLRCTQKRTIRLTKGSWPSQKGSSSTDYGRQFITLQSVAVFVELSWQHLRRAICELTVSCGKEASW